METESADRTSTYVMIESRDQFDITLSQTSIKVLYDLFTAFSRKSNGNIPFSLLTHHHHHHHHSSTLDHNNVTLINDIGPDTSVTLLSKAHVSNFCYFLC